MPRRRLRGRPLLVALALVAVLLVAVSRIWTDHLWFSQLGAGQVQRTRLLAGLALALGAGSLTALLVGGNLLLVERLHPERERVSPALRRRRRGGLLAVSALGAVMSASAALTRREVLLAWLYRTPFGRTDPWFDKDVSFYVFDYPWWRFVLGEVFWSLALTVVVVGFAQLAGGALSTFDVVPGPQGQPMVVRRSERRTGAAQAQLAVLCGLLLVAYAASCWLDRYGYAVTGNQLFTGLDYTDLHARVAAKNALALISLVCAACFLLAARLRRWLVPVTSLVLLLVASLLLQGIYPAMVQRFEVGPKGAAIERDYIAANIAATRTGFGLDDVATTQATLTTTPVDGRLVADAASLAGSRLLDPTLSSPGIAALQQVHEPYQLPTRLDVDRYRIDGRPTDVLVGAREISPGAPGETSWAEQHLVRTHGRGLVLADAGARRADGEPARTAPADATEASLTQEHARIYFGERSSSYVVVGAPAGSTPVELDDDPDQQGTGAAHSTYSGAGGVGIGNPVVRTMHAIRFADPHLLPGSRQVNEASRILYDRQPRERVEKLAPWLRTDSDPYPALVEGRVVWIVDGYTTTSRYPNSSQLDLTAAQVEGSAPRPGAVVNYVRNSVKAVVDAEDGSVRLFAWDEQDPLLRTWRRVYPGLVQPRSAIPAALLAHLHQPGDLFLAQCRVWARYHVSDPEAWFRQDGLWDVPADPRATDAQPMRPALASTTWPGQAQPQLRRSQVMLAHGGQEMAAYLTVDAQATGAQAGRLRQLVPPAAQHVEGPEQVFTAMSTDPAVVAALHPYTTKGSPAPRFGSLLTVPLAGGLLHRAPVYVQQGSGADAHRVARFEVVRFGQRVGIGDDLAQALASISAPARTGGAPTAGSSTGRAAAMQALARARTALDAAEAARAKGDLAGYRRELATARAQLAAAEAALR